MNANLLRLKHLADGWKGSDAPVTLNAADAAALDFPLDRDEFGGESSHATVKGKDLHARVMQAIRSGDSFQAEAATPNQLSVVGPAAQGGIAGSGATSDGLDDKKVNELREIAAAEKIVLQATSKAEMVAEIRAARVKK